MHNRDLAEGPGRGGVSGRGSEAVTARAAGGEAAQAEAGGGRVIIILEVTLPHGEVLTRGCGGQ